MSGPVNTPAIRTAIVGWGRAGWNIHAAELKERIDFQVVAAVDPCPTRQEEARGHLKCPAFSSLTEMLSGVRPELVVIASPHLYHEQDSLAVLASGASCVLEKPMAPTWASARRIVEASHQSPGELFVFHQHLFLKDYRFLAGLASSGILGEIYELRINWVRYTRRDDWLTLRSQGGGLLQNYASHALSITLPLLESPVKAVTSLLRQIKDPGDCEDHVHLLLEAANGRIADVFISTSCAAPLPRFLLLGSRGSAISLNEDTAEIRHLASTSLPPLMVKEGPAEGRRYLAPETLSWNSEIHPLKEGRGTADFYENVFAVMRHGETMAITPTSALEVARVVEWAAKGSPPPGSLNPLKKPSDHALSLAGEVHR